MATIKTLRVCLSNELPEYTDRTNDFLYLVYDKLFLLLGKNFYSDPFVIVESFPQNPISGILYIGLDGYVKAFRNGGYDIIAQIESETQIEALKNMGTTYMLHASKRYIDRQTRCLMLPYHNGTYMLTVNLAKDLKINEKTVIRYDPKTEQFYIDGEHEFEDFRRYHSGETDSVSVKVEDHYIHADLKLSQNPSNILRMVGDGLFASVEDMLSNAEFREFRKEYSSYKEILGDYMVDLRKAIDEAKISIGEYTVAQKIQEAIEDYYGEMVDVFEKYDKIAEQIDVIKTDAKTYTDKSFDAALKELTDLVNKSVDEQWGSF